MTHSDLIAKLREAETALGRIAGKNDFSQSAPGDIGLDAQAAIYECELIARDAIEALAPTIDEIEIAVASMERERVETVKALRFANASSVSSLASSYRTAQDNWELTLTRAETAEQERDEALRIADRQAQRLVDRTEAVIQAEHVLIEHDLRCRAEQALAEAMGVIEQIVAVGYYGEPDMEMRRLAEAFLSAHGRGDAPAKPPHTP